MNLRDLLQHNRISITGKWRDCILETYPPDGATFLKRQKNRFLNPVGDVVSTEVEHLFDALIGANSFETAAVSFEKILKIRAVQDFSPQQAVGFAFSIKEIIRAELEEDLSDPDLLKELIEMERQVDRVALIGFDVYMQCREKINEIRISELKRGQPRRFQNCSTVPDDESKEYA